MFWVFCRSLSATLVSSFRGGRVQISVQVFSSPNTKQSCRPIIPRKPISLPFTLKLLLLCFRFVLFLNILRFVFGFRLQIPERTSRSKCTTQAHVHEERQRLICWSNLITEHSQAILNSLYSFYWNLTRNWELRGSKMNREWIHSKNKLSQEYKDGIQSFIELRETLLSYLIKITTAYCLWIDMWLGE
ncbi:uncharacterized protein LOC112185109 isoform X1 [Rosa chinensis]|nr:uncharacterized protein LOC112185109 isoform X1 [Rosa chinensis]XP_024179096.1 uncharacterized protein LOC112185109 isoform X1 [Rosa chinensis]